MLASFHSCSRHLSRVLCEDNQGSVFFGPGVIIAEAANPGPDFPWLFLRRFDQQGPLRMRSGTEQPVSVRPKIISLIDLLDDDEPHSYCAFQAADRFVGKQQGIAFKSWDFGLGYYRDECPAVTHHSNSSAASVSTSQSRCISSRDQRARGNQASTRPRASRDEWIVETVNCTSDTPIKHYMTSGKCRADLVCAQEVHVLGGEGRQFEQWLGQAGWNCSADDSCETLGAAGIPGKLQALAYPYEFNCSTTFV